MEYSYFFWAFNIAVVVIMTALSIYSARHWKGSGKYLCDDCRFNNPQFCLKQERPTAVNCTSYRPHSEQPPKPLVANADQPPIGTKQSAADEHSSNTSK